MCLKAFLGEVATWTGIVTGTLMFASPALFARWKWRGVAGATPAFMLWTGVPFFVGCVLYNLAHPTQGVGTAALRALVIVGAILQVPSLVITHHSCWSPSDDIMSMPQRCEFLGIPFLLCRAACIEQRSVVLMAALQRHVQLQAHTEFLVMLTEHHLGCLQVFAKGAKFSMFKPAEEMVYIGLDEQSRTKGKAAIDVAGAQTGKSMGSVLQQVVNGKHMHL